MADKTEPKKTEQPDAPKTTWVKSALPAKADGGNTVALWEQDPAHPGGEAYVAGDTAVEVALTPRVTQLLRDEKLVEASASEISAAKKTAKEAEPAK